MFKSLIFKKKNNNDQKNTNLTKNTGLFSRIFQGKQKISDEDMEKFEDTLIKADLGMEITTTLIKEIKKLKDSDDMKKSVHNVIRQYITNTLSGHIAPITPSITHTPHVIMMCGVNGNGKTTTTGKLANFYKQSGKSVMIAACDTFRAAASEQLTTWAERAGCSIFTGKENADPSSVAYQALKQAAQVKVDVLIVDTAGRMHNQQNFMEQLQKMTRVLKNIDSNSPQENTLVLDGNTGQNTINQINMFNKYITVNNIIITKMDGTAKFGTIVRIVKETGTPIKAVCNGEKIHDIKSFDIDIFCDKILN